MATVFKRGGKGSWIIQWYDACGKRQCKSSRTTDHAAAIRIANKLEADALLRKEGVIDPRLDKIAAQAGRPLNEHLDAFGDAQRSQASVEHVEDTRRCIEVVCHHQGGNH